jgi:hypothetical protein
MGDGSNIKCPKPIGEYLSNHTFDCGTLGWDFDPAYTAEITDNGDGSVHLKTTSDFGSLVPDKLPTESAEWVCEVKFRNQVGNGKISFRKPNNVWVSTPTIGDGVHSATYNGIIKELHVGADGDNTYEADYEYISIKKVVTTEQIVLDK